MTDSEREEAYQDIYDDVRAELDIGHIDNLYQHFISICQQLFCLAEYDFFHTPRNLPEDWLQEIATEFLEYQNNQFYRNTKFLIVPPNALPHDKRPLSYMPSEPIEELTQNDKCTRYNLAKVLWKEEFGKEYDKNIEKIGQDKHRFEIRKINSAKECQIVSIKEHLANLSIYLPILFGIDYDNTQPLNQRYESLRLLRILHDCTKKYSIDLGYLRRESVLRFQHKFPSRYREAMLFIRERIITPPTPYQMDFNPIIHLEAYVNAVRSYLHFLGDNLVDCIVNNLPNISWKVRQKIQEACCRLILFRLNQAQSSIAEQEVTQNFDVDAFRARTYIYFLTLGTRDSLFAFNSANMQKLDLPDATYSFAKLYANTKISLTEKDVLYDFCKKNKSDLIQCCWDADTVSDNTFLQAMKRNEDDYRLLARFSNYLEGKSQEETINGERLLLLIFLYERIKKNQINIPITSGYAGGHKAKPIKIKTALCKLSQWANDGFPDTDDIEIFLISSWLSHRIYATTTYRTCRIQVVERQMKEKLLHTWNATISPIYYGKSEYKDNILEKFTNSFITNGEMQRIGEWATKRYSYKMNSNYIIL